MSRIGKNPVPVPQGVQVAVAGQVVNISGKNGKQSLTIPPDVAVAMAEGEVTLTPRAETKRARARWGTSRALVATSIQGVSAGFTRNLEINGVGYRASVEGKNLNLQLGFSHEVRFPIPKGITIQCERPTLMHISGADKGQVGQVAAVIRGYRKPEPYKGKGIRYLGEKVREKEGKKK